jgi:hypothetical protein
MEAVNLGSSLGQLTGTSKQLPRRIPVIADVQDWGDAPPDRRRHKRRWTRAGSMKRKLVSVW